MLRVSRGFEIDDAVVAVQGLRTGAASGRVRAAALVQFIYVPGTRRFDPRSRRFSIRVPPATRAYRKEKQQKKRCEAGKGPRFMVE